MIKKYLNFLTNNSKQNKFISDIYIDETDYFKSDSRNNHTNQYTENVIVNRCVNLLSQSASHVPWVIYKNTGLTKKKIHDHIIYKLFQKPNKYQGGAEFFSEIISSKLLWGNVYILSSGNSNLTSLQLLHPKSVEINEGGYIYKHNNKTYKFPIDHKTGKSKILHIKNYNPNNSLTGVSSLKAAEKAIELHNRTTSWNCNLLKNGARPSGALILKDPNASLTEEQFERLKEQLDYKYTGSINSGKPLLLEGGFEWKDMSIHPKDMDFLESKNSAARDIALSFGIPPQLLGINGDNTYSNMQEARLALWEETIIPLLDNMSDSFSNWYSNLLGEEIIIDFDRDGISALSEKRMNNLEKISNANFMTINEKRALVNLPPINNGDNLL